MIKYKLIFNDDGYITGFFNVSEDEEFDYEGNLSEYPQLCEGWYKFAKGKFVVDEAKKEEIINKRRKEQEAPTWEETIEAQITYTAMITDTLIEEE